MLFTLREKRHEIADVWSFVFDPPEPFWWKAGQYLHFELPHEDQDDKGVERWFTIASAPFEGRVQVTTRITGSTFKKALAGLAPGDQVTAYGLEGDFVWPEGETAAVFVAAGIGITPYHSMLKQRLHGGEPTPVTLVYGNRTKEVVFKDELDRWSVEHPELQVYYKVGVRITAENLKEIIPDISDRLVYLSGPEPMVIDLAEGLSGIGLPKERIVRDEFPGYDQTNY
jgi:ferredoxin-NADP reductase